MCGEKMIFDNITTPGVGSPPRVRGKVNAYSICIYTLRITPACAGKSKITASKFYYFQDHPRVCGEKVKIKIIYINQLGSPPRVRGKGVPKKIG